jgi:hypothetical protein
MTSEEKKSLLKTTAARGPYIQFSLGSGGFFAHIVRTFILKLEVLIATLFGIFPGTLLFVMLWDLSHYGFIQYPKEKAFWVLWTLGIAVFALVFYMTGFGTLPVILHTTIMTYMYHVMMEIRLYGFSVRTSKYRQLEAERKKINEAGPVNVIEKKNMMERIIELEKAVRSEIEIMAENELGNNNVISLGIVLSAPFGAVILYSIPFIGYFIAAGWGFWVLASTPGLDTLDTNTRNRSFNTMFAAALLVILGVSQAFIITIPLTVMLGLVLSIIIGINNAPEDFLVPLLKRSHELDPEDGKITYGDEAEEKSNASISSRAFAENMVNNMFYTSSHQKEMNMHLSDRKNTAHVISPS